MTRQRQPAPPPFPGAAGDAAPFAGAAGSPAPAPPPTAGAYTLEDFMGEGHMPAFSAPPAPRLSEGTVVRAGGRLLCDLGLEAAEASPAASCLLAPREGDRVLVCRAPSGCWVLAVLERREAAAPAVVALPEDAEIRGGRIAVASDTLEVVNSGTVVSAARLTLRGILARADFTFLTVRARQLVRLASSFLARSVSSRVEAEGSMRVAAPDLRLDASETLRARAGTVDLKADGAAKVDGATVQLG